MTTVAEGIETSFQKDFLQEIDCDMLQGYVFSRPLPIKIVWANDRYYEMFGYT
ncbi:EAL domain-containing protein [Clostridioides difficile]|nr:EAL domain-containing protein [Clostridioides difficile]